MSTQEYNCRPLSSWYNHAEAKKNLALISQQFVRMRGFAESIHQMMKEDVEVVHEAKTKLRGLIKSAINVNMHRIKSMNTFIMPLGDLTQGFVFKCYVPAEAKKLVLTVVIEAFREHEILVLSKELIDDPTEFVIEQIRSKDYLAKRFKGVGLKRDTFVPETNTIVPAKPCKVTILVPEKKPSQIFREPVAPTMELWRPNRGRTNNIIEPEILEISQPEIPTAELEEEWKEVVAKKTLQKQKEAVMGKPEPKKPKSRYQNRKIRPTVAINSITPSQKKFYMHTGIKSSTTISFDLAWFRRPNQFKISHQDRWIEWVTEHTICVNDLLQLHMAPLVNKDGSRFDGSLPAPIKLIPTNFIRKMGSFETFEEMYNVTETRHITENGHHPKFNTMMTPQETIECMCDLWACSMRYTTSWREAYENFHAWIADVDRGVCTVKPKFGSFHPAGLAMFYSGMMKKGVSPQEYKLVKLARDAFKTEISVRANRFDWTSKVTPKCFTAISKIEEFKKYVSDTKLHCSVVNTLCSSWDVIVEHDSDKWTWESLVAYTYNWVVKPKLVQNVEETAGDSCCENPFCDGDCKDMHQFERRFEATTANYFTKFVTNAASAAYKCIPDQAKTLLVTLKNQVSELSGIVSAMADKIVTFIRPIAHALGLGDLSLKDCTMVALDIVRYYIIYINSNSTVIHGICIFAILTSLNLVEPLIEAVKSFFTDDMIDPNADSDETFDLDIFGKIKTIFSGLLDVNPYTVGIPLGIIALVLFGVSIKGKNLNDLGKNFVDSMKNMHFIGGGLLGASRFFEVLTKGVKFVFEWCGKKFFNKVPEDEQAAKDEEELIKEFSEWATEVDVITTDAIIGSLQSNKILQKKVEEAFVKGLKYQRMKFQGKLPDNISRDFGRLWKQIRAAANTVMRANSIANFRITPFHVQLTGHAGIGKSTLINKLTADIGQVYYPNTGNLVYSQGNTEQMDGYIGQPIYFKDDMFPANDYKDVIPMLTMISNCPLILYMSHLEEKGTYFTSEWMLTTTNTPYPMFDGLFCQEAVWRRRHILADVKIDEKVKNPATGQFDADLFAKHFKGQRSEDFPHLKFTIMSPMSNKPMENETLPDGLVKPLTNLSYSEFKDRMFKRYESQRNNEKQFMGDTSYKFRLIRDLLGEFDDAYAHFKNDATSQNKFYEENYKEPEGHKTGPKPHYPWDHIDPQNIADLESEMEPDELIKTINDFCKQFEDRRLNIAKSMHQKLYKYFQLETEFAKTKPLVESNQDWELLKTNVYKTVVMEKLVDDPSCNLAMKSQVYKNITAMRERALRSDITKLWKNIFGLEAAPKDQYIMIDVLHDSVESELRSTLKAHIKNQSKKKPTSEVDKAFAILTYQFYCVLFYQAGIKMSLPQSDIDIIESFKPDICGDYTTDKPEMPDPDCNEQINTDSTDQQLHDEVAQMENDLIDIIAAIKTFAFDHKTIAVSQIIAPWVDTIDEMERGPANTKYQLILGELRKRKLHAKVKAEKDGPASSLDRQLLCMVARWIRILGRLCVVKVEIRRRNVEARQGRSKPRKGAPDPNAPPDPNAKPNPTPPNPNEPPPPPPTVNFTHPSNMFEDKYIVRPNLDYQVQLRIMKPDGTYTDFWADPAQPQKDQASKMWTGVCEYHLSKDQWDDVMSVNHLYTNGNTGISWYFLRQLSGSMMNDKEVWLWRCDMFEYYLSRINKVGPNLTYIGDSTQLISLSEAFQKSMENWNKLTLDQQKKLYYYVVKHGPTIDICIQIKRRIASKAKTMFQKLWDKICGGTTYLWTLAKKFKWAIGVGAVVIAVIGACTAFSSLFLPVEETSFRGSKIFAKTHQKVAGYTSFTPAKKATDGVIRCLVNMNAFQGYKIFNHSLLVPWHAVSSIKKEKNRDFYITLGIAQGVSHTFTINHSNVFYFEGTDLALIYCELFPGWGDRLKYIGSKQFMSVEKADTAFVAFRDINGDVIAEETPYKGMTQKVVTNFNNGIRIEHAFVGILDGVVNKGISGCPIFVSDGGNSNTNFIGGFQSYRNGERSYYSMVSREHVETGIDILATNTIKMLGPLFVDETSTEETSELLDDHTQFIGKVPKGKIVHTVPNTEFTKTCLYTVVPEERVPAILSTRNPYFDKTQISPARYSLNKHGRGTIKMLPTEFLKQAIREFSEYYQTIIDKPRVLSVIEAIQGNKDIDHINLNTSPGIPWIFERDRKGKKSFIEIDEDGKVKFVSPLLIKSVAEFDNSFKHNVVPRFSMMEIMKDELRPIGKAYGLSETEVQQLYFNNVPPALWRTPRLCKTRTITVMPVEFTILYRKYFADMFSQLYTKANEGTEQYCIGINCESLAATNTYMAAKSKNTVGLDLDVSNWDGHFSWQLFEACVEVINTVYEATPEDAALRRTLCYAACFGYVQFEDVVYQKLTGMPSGFPGTGDINTLGHTLAGYAMYLEIMYEANRFDLCHLSIYREYVLDLIYGDDRLLVIAKDIARIYNGVSIAEKYEKYGWPITTAAKTDGSDTLERPIEDLQFLKRKWIVDEHDPLYVHWAIDKSSIETLCSYVRRTHEPRLQFRENLNSALDFAVDWGKVYFEELKARINARLIKCNQSPVLMDYQSKYNEKKARYFGNSNQRRQDSTFDPTLVHDLVMTTNQQET